MKSPNLSDGVVTFKQYDQLVDSDYFKQVEWFSNGFVARVGPLIQRYNIRWVPDPLHQWSRQWEYIYIIDKIKKQNVNARIVDLGAGMSFLPYYLKKQLGFKNFLAVDYDKMLASLYQKVNKKMRTAVDFEFGDMRKLGGIKTGSVDFVYSISVLEHTNDYQRILGEIHRILKPGGALSFTFDISLDGLDDIPLKKAKQLVASLEAVFKTKTQVNLDKDLLEPDLVTSQKMSRINKKLLPWKIPLINVVKHLLEYGRFGKAYKNLTFCCLSVTKK